MSFACSTIVRSVSRQSAVDGVTAAQRHLGLAAQDGQRRAQLMADLGEEQHAQPIEVA